MNSNPDSTGKDSNSLVTVSEVAEQVGLEILKSQLEPGTWAIALYECEGNRHEALALYTKLRIRSLTKQRRFRLAKVRSLESRRLLHCMGDQTTREAIARTIHELLGHPTRGNPKNFLRPKSSLMWLAVLFFGMSGTVASLGRLYDGLLPEVLANLLTLVALLAGVAAVWTAVVIRHLMPRRWMMLGWKAGLVVSCNVLCLCSLFLGAKVIRRAVTSDTVAVRLPLASTASNSATAKPSAEPYLVSATTPGKTPGN